MKLIQKTIFIKLFIIIITVYILLNISQLHINSLTKIKLKNRDIKVYVDLNQQENLISNNKIINDDEESSIINIDTNDKNKNSIIDQLNIENKEEKEVSSSLVENQSESSQIIPSFNNVIVDFDPNIKFVPGEPPKYSARFCSGCSKCHDKNEKHLILY
ncbi:expressed protein [Dictyostelium purpureum]|uniref:Expressed protein n=1 Tax=Dictyostelium purpureum TaxID=5786 RepID=F1A1M3_DICPU|nr:uncharacterized protein DICPUDRAFT_99692 [Dictyostelium purpureum]EGC29905.1 expressed protein [Dictyostelium purpureum]|eukprot:XP_003293566.1 expressed protein [Dictyostelium purpureum]